jgi:hypothetical protein
VTTGAQLAQRRALGWAGVLVADVTDTPVWFLFGATVALAAVTTALAVAAILALRELGFAVQELEEVKRDRHVQVFSDLGSRWESREMTEALQLEWQYRPETLAALFEHASSGRARNPFRERRRQQAAQQTVVLLRVPNYFEDAAMIAKAGGLDSKLFTDNFGGVAVDEWKLWKPTIKKLQETDPLAYVEFERLATHEEKVDPGAPPQL